VIENWSDTHAENTGKNATSPPYVEGLRVITGIVDTKKQVHRILFDMPS
jgi:hypothetical protein